MVKSNRKRIEYIDIYRGIGIICMVLGHVGLGKTFSLVIHAFHMPMFFFISGYFYKGVSYYSACTFIVKKAKALVVPYLSYTILHYTIHLIVKGNRIDILELIKMLILNQYIPIAGALWFLMALFLTEVIYYFIDFCIGNDFIKTCLVTLLSLFGCVVHYWVRQPMPFSLGSALVALGFYHIGHFVGDGRLGQFNEQGVHYYFDLKDRIVIVLSIITVITIFINREVNMRKGIYNLVPLFWINAISAIIIIMNLSRRLEYRCGNIIIRFLKYAGKYSMVFLCLNQLVILCWFKLLHSVTAQMPGMINIVVSVMSLLTLRAVVYLCDKNTVIAKTLGLV